MTRSMTGAMRQMALAVAMAASACAGSAPPDATPPTAPPADAGAVSASDASRDATSADAALAIDVEGPVSPAADASAVDVAAATDVAAAPDVGPTVPRYVCPPPPYPAPSAGAAADVCTDFKLSYNYNEGPTWVARVGAFFFSNYPHYAGTRGDVIKYTPGGTCELFLHDVGCNGLAVTPDGNLVCASHQSRAVLRFDVTTKQQTTLADNYMGQMLQTPNDLVVHSNGTVYFTNPPFELGGRPPGNTIPIFRIDPAGKLSPVAMGKPANGIALSPDESLLYALQGGIWDLDRDGVPSNQRGLFVGGDGMAVDCSGNVYASGSIFSAKGQRLGSFPAGTNIAFGGADGKTFLVVGGGTRVRTVQMNVPGLP